MSAYQVLARKYRPQQFSEVVGQDHIIRTLENAIKAKRIAHAYLFVGPRGTGKTTTARIFAKALNCSASKEPTIKPCDECSNCREITAGTSMDVLEIDGASNNGVEQVRELRDTVRYAPSSSRFKIIYIDEVHMLSIPAFNALLKTLEEPPAHVKFIFATTDPQKIPLTILSRCQRFDLHRIPNDLIIKHLGKISKLEKVEISDGALLAIARGASGGLRDAESALDQIIAFCGDKIEEKDVLSIFGLAAWDQITQLTQGVIDGERGGILDLVSTLSQEGKDLNRLLSELVSHFRNILIIQAGAQPLESTQEEETVLRSQSGLLSRERTLRILEILSEGENQMRWALSRKISLEISLLKAVETKTEVLLEDVIQMLKQGVSEDEVRESDVKPGESTPRPVEREQRSEAPRRTSSSEAGPIAKPSSPITPKPSVKGSSEGKTLDVKELWDKLLEKTAEGMPMLKSALMEGRPLRFDHDTFVIGFDPEFKFQKELVDIPKNREWIQFRLKDLIGRIVRVQVAFEDDASIPTGNETPESMPTSSETSSFENDPLIKKALEIFRGRIIEVRK